MKKLRVFETFAGIGAQHKALERLRKNKYLDYDIVAISEWDIDALIAYDAMHKNPYQHKYNLDVSKLTFSKNGKDPIDFSSIDLAKQKELKRTCKRINNLGSIIDITPSIVPNHDLLIYSFPCQDLSIASMGRNKGIKKGTNTRSGLLWEIERILIGLKTEKRLPKYLLMENVPNLLSKKHYDDYCVWLKSLELLGYDTKTFVFDARDFGVPQSRKRVFAISKIGKNNIKYEDILNNKPKLRKNQQLQNILNKGEQYPDELNLATPNDTPSRRRMRKENANLDDKEIKYVSTLTTKQDRNPNSGMKTHKNKIPGKAQFRFLTPRECYMLMGFDNEDFTKVNKKSIRKEKLYQQAGNSIVVNVLEAICKTIYEEEYGK